MKKMVVEHEAVIAVGEFQTAIFMNVPPIIRLGLTTAAVNDHVAEGVALPDIKGLYKCKCRWHGDKIISLMVEEVNLPHHVSEAIPVPS